VVKKAPIFVAIDTPDHELALKIASEVKNFALGIKVGPVYFSKNSIDTVNKFSAMGLKIFVDNKIHDLGSTLEKSLIGISSHPIDYYTVHIANGLKTLRLAKKTVKSFSRPIKLLGISVITSHDDKTLSEIGIKNKMEEQIKQLASLGQEAELDGIVCDAKNIRNVKKMFKGEIFVPGIRLDKNKMNDQNPSRSLTPKEALNEGASYLVCGREVTEGGNPSENIKKIANSLN
jgi:orotidine-5'-phosphate decarboxylase